MKKFVQLPSLHPNNTSQIPVLHSSIGPEKASLIVKQENKVRE